MVPGAGKTLIINAKNFRVKENGNYLVVSLKFLLEDAKWRKDRASSRIRVLQSLLQGYFFTLPLCYVN
jgi:hypothetical protein